MTQFYEAGELHKRQDAELRARLRELEDQSEQHQAVISGLNTKYTDTIEKLQNDKARLEVREPAGASSADASVFYVQSLSSTILPVFIAENTDPGEGSKGVQDANRRVVLSRFILASEAAMRMASATAECEPFKLKFLCCPCSQQQLRRCQTELSRQVKQSSSVIQEKVPFNDTSEHLPPSLHLHNQSRAKEWEASVKHRRAQNLAVFVESIGAGIESLL